jgi:soluble lytic murein transglycosylase
MAPLKINWYTNRFAAPAATILFSAAAIFSQSPAELSQKIKTAVESKDFPAAIESLKTFESADEKAFRLNNYDYLLARMAEENGDLAAAEANFHAVVKRNSLLSDHAFWHLSGIARAKGDLTTERFYLRQLMAGGIDDLMNDAAQLRLAKSYSESKDHEAAIAVLQNISFYPSTAVAAVPGAGRSTGNDPLSREVMVMLALAYASSGQGDKARDVFMRLTTSLPDAAMPDDFALAAVRGLDALDQGSSETPEAEHLRRAAIYQFNRDFAAARTHYKSVIDNFPQSTNIPEAMYQIARGYVQSESYQEALPWLERLQSEYASSKFALDALNQSASAYARMKKTNEAVARYQKYISLDPDSETGERAYLNIIDAFRDSGEPSKALEWVEKTIERFNGKTTAAIAIFDRAKIQMSQNNWEEALRSLEELQKQSDLGGVRVPGGTNKIEAAFLHSLALEKLGRVSEAVQEYIAVPDGRNEYYGWRANERIKALAQDPANTSIPAELNLYRASAERSLQQKQLDAARKSAQSALRMTDDADIRAEMLDIVRRANASQPGYAAWPETAVLEPGRRELLKTKSFAGDNSDPHQAIADELLFLGLYDESAPELELAWRNKNTALSAEMSHTLAVLYLRGDRAYRAEAYAEPFWKKLPEDLTIETAPAEMLKMLYPTPYSAILKAQAGARGLDPRFTLSIMRQETRFRPDARSNAAARGLMQFISATADKAAGEVGRADYDPDELYQPETAIAFGSQYLKDLFDIFPDQPQAAAASYNGGEHNMGRWLKRAHSNDPDLYVADIAFSQSKDYVYKVMANYRIYCMLYDDRLVPAVRAQ